MKTPPKSIISVNIDNSGSGYDYDDIQPDELVAKFEEYGNTPPRTRIKIKSRDWERKQKA